jgi:acetyltransferase-like isoleucine patch superfamily enzyme
MKSHITRISNLVKRLYQARIKPFYYAKRHPGLTFGKNVIVRGHICLSGSVRVFIGDNTLIERTLRVYGEGEVHIGANVYLNGTYIGCKTSIRIGDRGLISDCAIMDTDYHNVQPHLRRAPLVEKASAPVRIEENAWIGSGALVHKGVVIGKNSVVGQASVVRESVPENVVVVGNPAVILKHLE